MSIYADIGTAAHEVLECCLIATYKHGIPIGANAYLGHEIEIRDLPHAELSPSGASRWMNCAAAPGMEREYGTVEETSNPRYIKVDEEMVAAVQTALDYVAKRVEEIGAIYGPVVVRTEHEVSPARFVGSNVCDGRLDIVLVADGYLEQMDYKHGAGVPVSVDDPQFDLYLLGLVSEYEIDYEKARSWSAILTVIQPRCELVEPRIRSRQIVELDVWMEHFANKVRAAVEATTVENPTFHPGEEQCRWCDAKAVCAAHTQWAMGKMGVVDTADALEAAASDVRTMSPRQLVELLTAREAIKGFLSAVEGHALELLRKGTAPPELVAAYKPVRSRTVRRWVDDDEEKMLRRLRGIKIPVEGADKPRVFGKRDLFESRLKSPKAVEDMYLAAGMVGLHRRAFDELVVKPEGAITIAPVSDPRDPVSCASTDPAAAFDNLPVS